MNFTKFEEEQLSPDILRHLTQLVADMGQDRDDLLVHVSKLEHNQQSLLSELHLLKKQNATLVHQNNLHHLASTMNSGQDDYCTLSGALEERHHKSPPPASTKVPCTPMKNEQEILQPFSFEHDIPGVECRLENAKSSLPNPDLVKNSKKMQPDQVKKRVLSIPVHGDDNEQFDPQEAEALFQAYRMNQGLSCPNLPNPDLIKNSKKIQTGQVKNNKKMQPDLVKNSKKMQPDQVKNSKEMQPDLVKNSKMMQPDATSDYISRVGALVDSLAMQYSPSRYNTSNPTNVSQLRHSVTDPECLFNSIPREMFAIWLFMEELSPEDELQYDLYLQKNARPPPIHSPTLQQPCVDWTSLHPSQYRNLPTPEKFSVQGCSQKPSFYTETEEDIYSSYLRKVLSWEKKRHPFDALFGFQTNLGVVAVPDQPLFGYRCCPVSGIWMIDATPLSRRCPASSATSSRRSRGSRGGGRREETATSVYT